MPLAVRNFYRLSGIRSPRGLESEAITMMHIHSELSYAKCLYNAFAPISLFPPVIVELLKIAACGPDTHTRSRIPGRVSVCCKNGVVRLLTSCERHAREAEQVRLPMWRIRS